MGMETKDNQSLPSDEDWVRAFDRIFAGSKAMASERFPEALIPYDLEIDPGKRSLTQWSYREMEELREYTDAFSRLARAVDAGGWPKDRPDKVEMSVRLKLSVYCHIMEGSFPYLVLLNLCRVAGHIDPCWRFLRRDSNDNVELDKRSRPKIIRNIDEKIRYLHQCPLLSQYDVTKLISQIWNSDMRNAFSHSEYCINPAGDIIYTKWLTGAAGMSEETIRSKHTVHGEKYHAINEYYKSACSYYTAFLTSFRCAIKPYMESKYVDIWGQKIRYDTYDEGGRWVPVQ